MFHQMMQWEGDDFLAELGALPKKKKKAAAAKKAKAAPKAKAPPKPKAKAKPRGPIAKKKAKAKAKKAAKAKAAPKPKTPAAKKLAALPPAKKAALKRFVQAAKAPAPAPGAVFAPAPPPTPEEAEVPEPEAPEPEPEADAPEPEAEATDMEESTPEESSEEGESSSEDEEMGAISMALKLPRHNVQGLNKGQLATRATRAIASVCKCSGKTAKKIRGKLGKKMQARGYPPGTQDKLLASINTLNAGLSRFNSVNQSATLSGRKRGAVDFQTEVLKRLGSTSKKLPRNHPTRKRAQKYIAKRVSGILLSTS